MVRYDSQTVRRGEQGAVLVFGAQAIAILVAFLLIIVHAFNSLTATVQVRRIAERVAGTMMSGYLEDDFAMCSEAQAQFQRLTEEGGTWSVTFGMYSPAEGFTPSIDCGPGNPGNAFEISLEVDQGIGMIGLVPKMFENQLALREVRVLGYVQSGKGYLRIL